MEGSLTKKTVEENLQKINVLSCASVVFIVGCWSPSCVRGDSCAVQDDLDHNYTVFLNSYNELPRQSTHRKQYLTSIAKKTFTGEMMSCSKGTFFALNY